MGQARSLRPVIQASLIQADHPAVTHRDGSIQIVCKAACFGDAAGLHGDPSTTHAMKSFARFNRSASRVFQGFEAESDSSR
ncbi:hypothetical protein A5722_04770 [Mycobacterium vulneris]|uniref:Uncharacterized protein n=1 Tax=Mycolicibacterium conceptionense TaxID=451644 RepID=A0A1A0PC96_9MYCO|nr:hypothetical protein A5718_16730 [Mycolicibacterium conceptionense]OBK09659.1 hypothetical protein A5637_03210 [Mycolicibacterium fortuitum]OCB45591.1 hypothetical protein A5721_16270 [Mycolicibacterium vulneris]ORW59953.1 hypothetical protein AWC21_11790 [Mycolicibacterium peregrinum]OBF01098.1 hypothetical protein A5731_19160 [Mycolicibacterium conceptionense]